MRVAVVGPCAAGKSTIVEQLIQWGYDAYVVGQEHSAVQDLWRRQSPDALIFLEVYGRKGLMQDQRFLTRYRLVDTIETDMYGSRGMLIYEKIH